MGLTVTARGFHFVPRLAASVVLAGVLAALGCQQPMRTPVSLIDRGEYGRARTELRRQVVDDRSSRRYLLDRMRVGVLTLADGYPQSSQTVFEEVYDVLRTQGINRDRTVQSIVLNEDLRIWKGEPFEQALALAYYSMVQAELGSWDNARAAANNALFYLKDFGENDQGQRLDTEAIARRSLLYERAIAAGATPDDAYAHAQANGDDADYLDHGYVPRPSNFTLGYLLAGIANQQLGRQDEASDHLTAAVRHAPELAPLADALRHGTYNTILVVSWGLGPQKEGYGPDNALARFSPRIRSDTARLWLRVGDEQDRSYPQVIDVNRMAADHMWNNLEDVRRAKSTIGTALLYGGVLSTAIGADHGSETAVYAGLGAMAAGAFLKAGAHVDIRYADVFPQRYYLVPLMLDDSAEPIELQIEGYPGSRVVLPALTAPTGPEAQLRYVRLPGGSGMPRQPPDWAVAGAMRYSSDHAQPDGPHLPYLLGGRDVRTPTEATMDAYQQSGQLRGLTLSDLRELYRLEGIRWTVEDQGGYADMHLLEGGTSLVAPLPGTIGFTRLFCGFHTPYDPTSSKVKNLHRQLRSEE